MTSEEVQAYLGAGLFLLAFVLGARASWRLRRRYIKAKDSIEPRFRPILFVIVVAVWIITIAAGWIGTLSMVRLLTSLTFPWTPPITLLIATVVVFIPVMFDVVISRVAGEEDENEPRVNKFLKAVFFRPKDDPPTT